VSDDFAPQGSPEWHAQRAGKLTASRFHEAVTKTKNGEWGASRANYRAEIVVARKSNGWLHKRFVSDAMRWGTETQPQAQAVYEIRTGLEIAECGFIDHPGLAGSGASPDGLIGEDGMVEFKCPNTATHFDMILGGPIKHAYVLQMQWQMACTGRAWCDFVSFDPRVEERLRLHVRRHTRDDGMIERMGSMAVTFLAEVDDMIAQLDRVPT
jgi:putative phage-type endonuclease